MVMHGPAFEHGQDADVLHCFLSPFGMYSVVGAGADTGHMQPIQLAFHAETAFIEMSHIGGDQLLLDDGSTGFRLLNHRRIRFLHQGFGWRMTIEVTQRLAGACPRDKLVVVQIGGLRFETWPVLHRLGHFHREGA